MPASTLQKADIAIPNLEIAKIYNSFNQFLKRLDQKVFNPVEDTEHLKAIQQRLSTWLSFEGNNTRHLIESMNQDSDYQLVDINEIRKTYEGIDNIKFQYRKDNFNYRETRGEIALLMVNINNWNNITATPTRTNNSITLPKQQLSEFKATLLDAQNQLNSSSNETRRIEMASKVIGSLIALVREWLPDSNIMELKPNDEGWLYTDLKLAKDACDISNETLYHLSALFIAIKRDIDDSGNHEELAEIGCKLAYEAIEQLEETGSIVREKLHERGLDHVLKQAS